MASINTSNQFSVKHQDRIHVHLYYCLMLSRVKQLYISRYYLNQKVLFYASASSQCRSMFCLKLKIRVRDLAHAHNLKIFTCQKAIRIALNCRLIYRSKLCFMIRKLKKFSFEELNVET